MLQQSFKKMTFSGWAISEVCMHIRILEKRFKELSAVCEYRSFELQHRQCAHEIGNGQCNHHECPYVSNRV